MKSVKMFGKKVPVLAILLMSVIAVGGVYGALLPFYGTIVKTVDVNQAVQLDGFDYTEPIVETLDPEYSGATICQLHYLENLGAKPALVTWDYNINGYTSIQGIDVLVLASVHEEYSTAGKPVVATIVKMWECSTTKWVVDISSDNPAGHTYGVGLVISLGNAYPAFQVFQTGSTGIKPDNTWLYQKYPWDTNPYIPLDQIPGITASGDSSGKHFEIWIDCERLGGAGATYYWNMQLRTNLISWVGEPYNWGADVTSFIENHNGIPIVFPYTLEPGERLYFNLAFNLDINLLPGTYTVTTVFKPAP